MVWHFFRNLTFKLKYGAVPLADLGVWTLKLGEVHLNGMCRGGAQCVCVRINQVLRVLSETLIP